MLKTTLSYMYQAVLWKLQNGSQNKNKTLIEQERVDHWRGKINK